MKKLPNELDDPIDNFLSYISDIFCPIFKSLGFTPNGITALSLVLGIIAIIFMFMKQYKLAAVFYFIAYFFDVMDGYYARKYKMETPMGGRFDMISDKIKNYTMMIILFYLFIYHGKYALILLLLFLIATASIHLGCQEKYMDIINSSFQKFDELSSYKKLCPGNNKECVENTLKVTRFGGGGVVVLIISIIIYNLDYLLTN
ncbi:MAG: CDP-alcohol phosphatidyltransferase [Edafosvirus sp.]|uniref:CDP-alcohol phosphatidyltransferase n=1 Tax=Edafosvirus sp. TaxID=2487765 RepID=A0A3G4ZSU3_9VIRU|nr:MAG: CDP-alcohol phosphatidyltransferase [Edafosvirus sp.]